ncbi:MAG: MYG1 family protein [Lachnospiraceae bacterium]|nr:MYG1 family protein [Lachnospiraceae bacterium]
MSQKENVSTENLTEGFTHGGVFHADDVFATALLKILNPNIKITRGFAIPKDFTGIVYDIGGGKYDHHQKGSRVRKNGVPYAAFGLLWEQFGKKLLSEEDAQNFDENFIQPIDQSDNTGEENMISCLISDRLPTWQEAPRHMDEIFWEAVRFAQTILERRIKQIQADREAYEIVYQKASKCNDNILYLEQAVPWKEALQKHGKDIWYVIYPSLRGGYNIQAVPDREDKNALRHPFPENWRGASAQVLQNMTGISDLTFCHRSGFLSATETLEGAYSTAKLAILTDYAKTS